MSPLGHVTVAVVPSDLGFAFEGARELVPWPPARRVASRFDPVVPWRKLRDELELVQFPPSLQAQPLPQERGRQPQVHPC